MLAVNNISKRFADGEVLANVTFTLAAGEKAGLIGANGSGKSTLLRILTGLEEADSGSIRWEPGAAPGYMPQQLEAGLDLTVEELLASGQSEWLAARHNLDSAIQVLAAKCDPIDAELDHYAHALERFDALGGYAVEQRMDAVLTGLGIGAVARDRPVRQLSGGEKTRAALGALLLSRATVLLLDEPTNYLDLPALNWLEGWITEASQAAIIVSHDREFLDRTVTSILALDEHSHKLTVYRGGYSDYLEASRRERDARAARYRDQVERVEKVERHIRELRNQSRRIEHGTVHFHYRKIAKGIARRATVQERRLQRSLDGEDRIEKPEYDQRMYFGALLRSGIDDQRMILSAHGIGCRFGDHVLFEDVEITVRGGDRVAVIGSNGSGKTTLLEVLAGVRPANGTIATGSGVLVGYLRQEHLRRDSNPEATVVDAMREVAVGEESELRALLDQFLFTGAQVMKKVHQLSYGERVRLELARLVGGGANVLLLDEPTNHLDLPAVERLQVALAAYRGALVVASHDRAFVDALGLTSVWLLGDGRLQELRGSDPLAEALDQISR